MHLAFNLGTTSKNRCRKILVFFERECAYSRTRVRIDYKETRKSFSASTEKDLGKWKGSAVASFAVRTGSGASKTAATVTSARCEASKRPKKSSSCGTTARRRTIAASARTTFACSTALRREFVTKARRATAVECSPSSARDGNVSTVSIAIFARLATTPTSTLSSTDSLVSLYPGQTGEANEK